MSISIAGVGETLAALARVAAVGAIAGEAAVAAVSQDVADTARAIVPVDTGELRDSIQVTEEGVVAGSDHAVYVEFGTYKMGAQPYMRPAADEAAEGPAVAAATAAFGSVF